MARAEQLQLFGTTDVGRRRPHNEDHFLVDRDLGLCIVADGMGGHAAGEVASELAVATIHEVLQHNREPLLDRAERGSRSEVTPKQVLGLIESAVQNASARIHQLAQNDPRTRGMGTTLSLVLVLDTLAYVAHVGDSRVYLGRAGTVRQLTEDHTMAAEMLRLGMVTADRLDKIPHRNAITRAVGIYPHVNVDAFTCEVVPGDQLLLATDGFTGYVRSSEELLEAFRVAEGEEAVRRCVGLANERGGKDNITVVLLRIGLAGADDGVRARRLALKHEVLARVPLFCRLEQRELESIAGIATVGLYEAGEAVMREGEVGDALFVLLSGRLSVSRGDALLGELGPGEHLGEMALIRTTPRSATVTALVDSELAAINRRDFHEVIRTEPGVAVKLLWQFVLGLANRLEQTSQDLSVARRALALPEARSTATEQGAPLGGGLVLGPSSSSVPILGDEADPFSSPPPASLGRFRLGYAALHQEGQAQERRELAETVRERGGRAVRVPPPASGSQEPSPAAPRPNAADTLPAAWHSMPVGDGTLPGIGQPPRAAESSARGASPSGSGDVPPPMAERRVAAATRPAIASGGVVLPTPKLPAAPGAVEPAAVLPQPSSPPAPTRSRGMPVALPVPTAPARLPAAVARSEAATLPALGDGPESGTAADERRPTHPLGAPDPGTPDSSVSMSEAKTTPMRGQEHLRDEIENLRDAFKERLRRAREGGGRNESD